ncbi:MAG: hypothetical protein QGG73_05305 [Candidatus Hydrogenedentes bacterium]|jgi:hypothetical protein|nr:hypothetical protein [Candidatus Hydrogenedentota bacterium]
MFKESEGNYIITREGFGVLAPLAPRESWIVLTLRAGHLSKLVLPQGFEEYAHESNENTQGDADESAYVDAHGNASDLDDLFGKYTS